MPFSHFSLRRTKKSRNFLLALMTLVIGLSLPNYLWKTSALASATNRVDFSTQLEQAVPVTNTNDTGAGSLRQAILDANSSPGTQTIAFNIPGAGVQTIAPTSALPTITDPVIIDGTTQPGFAGSPLIELNGANAGADVNGLVLDAGSSTIRGLVINRFAARSFGSPNTPTGIVLQGNGGNNMIEGNFIGTDATGTVALANGAGVHIRARSSNNVIGGVTIGARNLISGNGGTGIVIGGDPNFNNTTGNQVRGNFIGTDVTGTRALGNTGGGVSIVAMSNNTIGGTTTGARNVISANGGDGISFFGGSGNSIRGNFIGTQMDGVNPLGNNRDGVSIGSVTGNSTVGGTESGAGNVIAFNSRNGVIVLQDIFSNAILSNSIFSNGSLGIRLDINGPDSARRQIPPVITSAISANGTTTIQGTLRSAPNAAYNLQFFSNNACDPSGAGEGQTFIGSATTTTDGNGSASFNSTLTGGLSPGQVVTATATDPTGNTSQFSVCRQAIVPPRYTISGQILEGTNGLGGVTVTLSGTQSATTMTDANGNYSFGNLTDGGSVTVTPSRAFYIFTPESRSVSIDGDRSGINFTATLQTYNISGRVTTNGGGLSSVTVALNGGGVTRTATTDANGSYSFANLPGGSRLHGDARKNEFHLLARESKFHSLQPPDGG
jgi:hypothetical protein